MLMLMLLLNEHQLPARCSRNQQSAISNQHTAVVHHHGG
jgi:hypothetical protein